MGVNDELLDMKGSEEKWREVMAFDVSHVAMFFPVSVIARQNGPCDRRGSVDWWAEWTRPAGATPLVGGATVEWVGGVSVRIEVKKGEGPWGMSKDFQEK